MQAVRDGRRMTVSEYLELERSGDVRHEYVNGEAYAMAGGTPRHSAVCMNISAALHAALRGGPCRAFQSDLRVHIPATGMYTYADGAIVCGAIVPSALDPHAVTNPRVLIEVLSATTEAHDRGAKFKHYQSIAALEEYVLVDPNECRVEVYRRVHDDRRGEWLLATYTQGAVEIAGASIPVDEIYARLEGLTP